MYAVFKTGGKQYRATQGQKVKLEKITANSGDKVLFTEVLMVGEGGDVEIGTPFLANATVEAKVLEEGKDKKIEVIKFKRRRMIAKITFPSRFQHSWLDMWFYVFD